MSEDQSEDKVGEGLTTDLQRKLMRAAIERALGQAKVFLRPYRKAWSTQWWRGCVRTFSLIAPRTMRRLLRKAWAKEVLAYTRYQRRWAAKAAAPLARARNYAQLGRKLFEVTNLPSMGTNLDPGLTRDKDYETLPSTRKGQVQTRPLSDLNTERSDIRSEKNPFLRQAMDLLERDMLYGPKRPQETPIEETKTTIEETKVPIEEHIASVVATEQTLKEFRDGADQIKAIEDKKAWDTILKAMDDPAPYDLRADIPPEEVMRLQQEINEKTRLLDSALTRFRLLLMRPDAGKDIPAPTRELMEVALRRDALRRSPFKSVPPELEQELREAMAKLEGRLQALDNEPYPIGDDEIPAIQARLLDPQANVSPLERQALELALLRKGINPYSPVRQQAEANAARTRMALKEDQEVLGFGHLTTDQHAEGPGPLRMHLPPETRIPPKEETDLANAYRGYVPTQGEAIRFSHEIKPSPMDLAMYQHAIEADDQATLKDIAKAYQENPVLVQQSGAFEKMVLPEYHFPKSPEEAEENDPDAPRVSQESQHFADSMMALKESIPQPKSRVFRRYEPDTGIVWQIEFTDNLSPSTDPVQVQLDPPPTGTIGGRFQSIQDALEVGYQEMTGEPDLTEREWTK
jgi:hypothetical protein